MDLVMPVMNGAEATRQIMQRSPCPVLVVTATVSGNYALVCEALGHGAYDAVCTPTLSDRSPAEAGADLLGKLASVDRIRRRLDASTPRARPIRTHHRPQPLPRPKPASRVRWSRSAPRPVAPRRSKR
jgi:two-component system, chemotaxis family, response regulator WspF